jgi:RloB-like protein
LSPYRRGSEILGRGTSRPPEQRRGNRIIYAVAEGEGTEYDYLGHLNRVYGSDLKFLIRMPTQRRGLSPSQVVSEASRAVREPGVEGWALFDHDGRSDIDQVCSQAKRQNVKVGLSHPCFELWLLLHFQDFSPAQHGSNQVLMQRLRAAHPAFADYGRRGTKRIYLARFEALCENDGVHMAIIRAKRLASCFTNETPANRDPSTDVYLLLERLGIS